MELLSLFCQVVETVYNANALIRNQASFLGQNNMIDNRATGGRIFTVRIFMGKILNAVKSVSVVLSVIVAC